MLVIGHNVMQARLQGSDKQCLSLQAADRMAGCYMGNDTFSTVILVCCLQGWTPLQTAVSSGHEAVTEWLLANGAEVNAQNSGGRAALHYAVRYRTCFAIPGSVATLGSDMLTAHAAGVQAVHVGYK